MTNHSCIVCAEAVTPHPVTTDFVVCSGPCKRYTHQKCSGVPKTVINIMNTGQSLRYFCAPCRNAEASQDAMLLDMKASIEKLTTTVDMLVQQSVVDKEVSTNAAGKRRRVDDGQPPTAWPSIGSVASPRRVPNLQPRPPPKRELLIGSSESDTVQTVASRKSVVASMLHPMTEPPQLEAFLRTKLALAKDSPDIRCTLLIPAGRKREELSFIAMRVSATEAAFAKLLEPTTWPMGVSVREFVTKPRTDRPLGTMLPQLPLPSAQPTAS